MTLMSDEKVLTPVERLEQMQPIFEAVSRRYRIPVRSIVGAGKSAMQLEARQVCCWLGSKLTQLSSNEIAVTVGRGRTAFGQALARIERLRADEPFMVEVTDQLLQELRGA